MHVETVPQLGWWRPIVAWKQFCSWVDDCPSNISSFFCGYLIYPPGNDRWKCHLKWYIIAPWAPSVAFAHRCRWGSHSLEPINLCWVELGHTIRMNAGVFFPPCPPLSAKLNPFRADCVVHPPVSSMSWSWCTEPRSLPRPLSGDVYS